MSEDAMLRRLLDQIKQRGLWVEPGAAPGSLNLCGPASEKTPEVVAAVKGFKRQLLELYGPKPPAFAPTVEAVAVPPDDPGRVCDGCGVRHWLGDGVTAADVGLGCAMVVCPYRGGNRG